MALIFVVDIEATMAEDNVSSPQKGFVSDIVEIGFCQFDPKTQQAYGASSFLVKPTRSAVGDALTDLTGITAERVAESGMGFGRVCDLLITTFSTNTRPWVSWGFYDYGMLTDQCKAMGVPFPFGKLHYDLKRWYWLMGGCKKRPKGLRKVLAAENMQFQGMPHRAMDDAVNTARILALMMERYQ